MGGYPSQLQWLGGHAASRNAPKAGVKHGPDPPIRVRPFRHIRASSKPCRTPPGTAEGDRGEGAGPGRSPDTTTPRQPQSLTKRRHPSEYFANAAFGPARGFSTPAGSVAPGTGVRGKPTPEDTRTSLPSGAVCRLWRPTPNRPIAGKEIPPWAAVSAHGIPEARHLVACALAPFDVAAEAADLVLGRTCEMCPQALTCLEHLSSTDRIPTR
jgi:hypothetical protein